MTDVSEFHSPAIADQSPASVSVVVIGRNEGLRLAACLRSISCTQGVSLREVIYVDSDSTDGSPDLARSFGAQVIVVHPQRPTAAIGRNAGWRHATAEMILFLDGDTILHPDFLRAALREMLSDRTVAAVWGHRRETHPEASIYNRVLDLDWVYAPGVVEFCGGDVLMRRAVLGKTSGFDETLIAGEEPELCRRIRALGYKILHIDQPMTGHDLQMMSFRQYWRRATRAGHAYAEVSQRFQNSEDPFWAADRRRNLIRGGFWILSAAAAAISIPWLGLLPLLLWTILLVALSARSAWKARWKGSGASVLFLYGMHSHLQQVPILFGQLQYEWNARQGRSRQLIEYK